MDWTIAQNGAPKAMIPTPDFAAATEAPDAVDPIIRDHAFMSLWREELVARLARAAKIAAESARGGDGAVRALVAEMIEAAASVSAAAEGRAWADAIMTDLIRLSGEHEPIAAAIAEAVGDPLIEATAPAGPVEAADDAPTIRHGEEAGRPILFDPAADLFFFGETAEENRAAAARAEPPLVVVDFPFARTRPPALSAPFAFGAS